MRSKVKDMSSKVKGEREKQTTEDGARSSGSWPRSVFLLHMGFIISFYRRERRVSGGQRAEDGRLMTDLQTMLWGQCLGTGFFLTIL